MATSNRGRQARGSLRIIGGRWRGRKLQFPNVPGLRPTPDRVRETLFNWLDPYISGADCLDLFCGSGVLGIECASRGAATVTLVDTAAAVQKSIEKNCTQLACSGIQFVHADVLAWLARKKFNSAFDIVFIDPPYEIDQLTSTMQALRNSAAIGTDCWIYAEAPQHFDLQIPDDWHLHRELLAGNNRYYLFRAGRPSC